MRINFTSLRSFTRLGLVLIIIGMVLLFNFWTAPLPQSSKMDLGYVKTGESLDYGLFMAPVGLGNLVVEGDTLEYKPDIDDITRLKYEVPVHLVVVSPSNLTLVDVEFVTPHTVQLNFDERGEYIVHVTNIGNESYPIPVSLKFPSGEDVVNREADKFFVSVILTVSGVVLFCLGLGISLFLKHKKKILEKAPMNSSKTW